MSSHIECFAGMKESVHEEGHRSVRRSEDCRLVYGVVCSDCYATLYSADASHHHHPLLNISFHDGTFSYVVVHLMVYATSDLLRLCLKIFTALKRP